MKKLNLLILNPMLCYINHITLFLKLLVRITISLLFKNIVLIIHIIALIVLVTLIMDDFSVVYCMDDRLELINKINKCEHDCTYYREQLAAADANFKNLLSLKSQLSEVEFNKLYVDAKSALDDTNTNLNSETRALSYFKNKLSIGDYSSDNFTTAQKRKASDE